LGFKKSGGPKNSSQSPKKSRIFEKSAQDEHDIALPFLAET
jgi:hypothetical protein